MLSKMLLFKGTGRQGDSKGAQNSSLKFLFMQKMGLLGRPGTLKSLIDEQTGINEQDWKKFHPTCLYTK